MSFLINYTEFAEKEHYECRYSLLGSFRLKTFFVSVLSHYNNVTDIRLIEACEISSYSNIRLIAPAAL